MIERTDGSHSSLVRGLGSPYHIGLSCASLSDAMATLGVVLGSEFTPPQHVEFDGYALEYVFSMEGPSYLELCEGTEKSPWYAKQGINVHHLGFWSDDVDADSRRLEAAGLREEWSINASGRRAAYLRIPGGLLVELVDSSRRAAFESLMRQGPGQ